MVAIPKLEVPDSQQPTAAVLAAVILAAMAMNPKPRKATGAALASKILRWTRDAVPKHWLYTFIPETSRN